MRMISIKNSLKRFLKIKLWSSSATLFSNGVWTSPSTKWESTKMKFISTLQNYFPSEVILLISSPTAVILILSASAPISFREILTSLTYWQINSKKSQKLNTSLQEKMQRYLSLPSSSNKLISISVFVNSKNKLFPEIFKELFLMICLLTLYLTSKAEDRYQEEKIILWYLISQEDSSKTSNKLLEWLRHGPKIEE